MANELKAYANKLKKLEGKLKRSNDVPKVLASELENALVRNLPQFSGADDYAIGGANSTGVVRSAAVNQTASLIWSGDQIWYLEFGTGSPAVGKYPDPQTMAEAGGYYPRPDGHVFGSKWVLPMDEYRYSTGAPIVSRGWQPYAPFYFTVLLYKSGKFNQPMEDALRKQLENLL